MPQIGLPARRTFVPASSTDFLIAGGEPIIITAIVCTSTSGSSTVTFEKAGTADLETVVVVGTTGSIVLDFKWIADFGLQVTTPAGSTATIWHSHAGR